MRKFYLPLYSGIHARINSPATRGLRWIAVAALLLVSTTSYATHLAGGELTYKWISGTTYEFHATFYRDCAGVNAPNTLTLNYSSSCTPGNSTKSATLNLVPGTGQEITLPCPFAQTTCNGGTNPGFQKWEYIATVDIKYNCSDWVFSWSSSARNTAITTIQTPGSDAMYIEATLDNSVTYADGITYPSSPTFNVAPVTILCVGQPAIYNPAAFDPNGDSLVYSFICPRIAANTCVTYNAPYSPTSPIGSVSGVVLDAAGNVTVTPNTIQVGVTAVLVKKYHNGVLKGSVIRDMQIQVVNCSNTSPTATGINGAAYATNHDDTVCAGSNICFNVLSNDPDAGQVVTMTWVPDPALLAAGATFGTLGSPHPTGTFCWTPSAANARSAPYTFVVTVKDNNCPTNGSNSYAFSVWVPPVAVAITPTNISCNGGTGSALAVGSGGTGPYTYLWNPTGQTTATATGLSAGVNYTVTTTDKNGCAKSDTVTLTTASTIVGTISSQTNVSCKGGNDGSAVITPSGGAGGYTHHWSNGQTSDTATALAAGTYTDTIRDANGCIGLANVTITEPVLLTATITTQQNASCKGQANGTLVVTPAGGTTIAGLHPYTYLWAPSGGTDSTATLLGAGTYTVTVTDAKGCTVTKTATITEPATLVPLITAITVIGPNNITCAGASNGSVSVTIMGGTPGYSYLWSPGGATDSVLTGLPADTFCVHVTDDNGCTADTCVILTQPDSLKINITSLDISQFAGNNNISCHFANDGYVDTTYLVTGGTQPYHYSWSPGGETTKGIDSLIAGTYTLTVTDTNGCVASTTVTLVEPDSISFSVGSQVNAGCKGDSSGSVQTSTSGGTMPYTYAWSTGDTTANLSGLPAGSYTVQVTDANGCFKIMVVTITEPVTVVPLITAATVIGGNNIGCTGDTTGKAWVTVTGGTLPYSYLWNNGSTIDTVYNLGAGPISVIVTDSNGCRKTAVDTITQPEPLAWTDSLSAYIGNYNVSCNQSTNGLIQISVDYRSGTPGYTYQWSPGGSTDSTLTGIGAGTYTVIVTDANGCKDSAAYTLTAPDTLRATLVADSSNGWNIGCHGDSSGNITVTVLGGTNPFQFLWSNGATTQNINNVPAGKYIVTVTDTNGCTYTDSLTLVEPPALASSISAKTYKGGWNVSCYGYDDGFITDSVSGGTPPYVYQWSTGNTNDTLSTLDLVGAGTYTVIATDLNGCSIANTITLTQPDTINPNVVIDSIGIYNIQCYGGTACIHLTPTGGTPGYTYFWVPGDSSRSDFCGPAGTYTVTVTDTNGCIAIRELTLTQPDSIFAGSVTLSNHGGSNISCDSACDGTITITMVGGVRPFTYLWSPNVSTDSVATSLCAGSYTITVTDADSCSIVISTSLSEPPPLKDTLLLSDYAGYQVSCAGNDGSITVVATGGTAPYHYNWSPGVSTTSSATALNAGSYTITVTDSNGCSVTDTVTLTAPIVIVATDSVSDYHGRGVSCNGDTNGYIHVFVTGGVAPYIHRWSTGNPADTTANLDNIGAGTYTDTITDQQGCRTTITATITQAPVLAATDTVTDHKGHGTSCNNTSDGTITILASGGTRPYTYTWSPNVSTDSVATPLGVGRYSYTVTDVNGCTATGSDTIIAPPPLIDSVAVSSYGSGGVMCHGDSSGYIHLNPSGGTPAYTYMWSYNNATTQNLDNIPPGVYTYTVTDANGCTIVDSATINDKPAIGSDAGQDFPICGDTAHFKASTPASGTTGTWSVLSGTGTFVDPNDPNTIAYGLTIGINTFVWTVTDGFCPDRDTVAVDAFAVVSSAAGSDYSICPDSVKDIGVLNASDPKPGTGFWSSLGTASLVDSLDPNTHIVDGTMTKGANAFVWVVTNGPCVALDTVIVTYRLDDDGCSTDLVMPTGFTPNGDGYNDHFHIQGIGAYPQNKLTIFNRWGNIVYSVDNYVDETWNGQNNSGELLPDGTYFAILELKTPGKTHDPLHGYVDIRKEKH